MDMKAIAMFDALECGQIGIDEYTMYFIDSLKNFIKSRIMKHSRLIGAEFDDLMSAGNLAIIENIKAYDPRKSMPTTFFGCRIDDALKQTQSNTGISQYYVTKIAALDKVAKKYGFEDCLDPQITAEDLAVLAEMPVKTVSAAIEQKRQSRATCSLTAVSENQADPYAADPQDLAVRNELYAHVRTIYDSLSAREKILLAETYLAEEDKVQSLRSLVKTINLNPAKYGFSKAVTAKTLAQEINGALRKLKYHPGNKKILPTWSDEESFEIEMSSLDDIEQSFDEGLL